MELQACGALRRRPHANKVISALPSWVKPAISSSPSELVAPSLVLPSGSLTRTRELVTGSPFWSLGLMPMLGCPNSRVLAGE